MLEYVPSSKKVAWLDPDLDTGVWCDSLPNSQSSPKELAGYLLGVLASLLHNCQSEASEVIISDRKLLLHILDKC